MDAEMGIEPIALGHEPNKLPLLYSAILKDVEILFIEFRWSDGITHPSNQKLIKSLIKTDTELIFL
jgi:hypothetical protein